MDMLLVDDDIALTADQDLALVTLRPAIAQDIKMGLRTWLGETPYDTTEGVPYLQVIFAGTPDVVAAQFILEQNILRRPGVTGVTLEPLQLNPQTRVLTATGVATSEEGPIDFSFILGETT